MTAEEAQDIYLQARTKAMSEYSDYSKPVIQRRCDLRGWQAVVDAITKEADSVWAMRLNGIHREVLG